jgi:plasmid stabilization system protein ParE
MRQFTVELTEAALIAIAAQARYIAVEQQAPLNAERWLQRVWDAVDSLEEFPRRYALAEESDALDYEVRQLHVGGAVLLFSVDYERNTVWVLALRGEGQLPQPESLPSSHTDFETERIIEALQQPRTKANDSGDGDAPNTDETVRETRAKYGRPYDSSRTRDLVESDG